MLCWKMPSLCVSGWSFTLGPGVCVLATTRSNRPDAPRGDERASIAVSQRRCYFTLHERRMKREEEGELVTHSAFWEKWKPQQCCRSAGLLCRETASQFASLWSYVFPCLTLLATLGNPGHLSVIYPTKLKKRVWFDISWSSLSPWEQYRIMPLGDWLSDRFCQPQHSQ